MKKLFTVLIVVIFAVLILGFTFETQNGNYNLSSKVWNTTISPNPQNVTSTTLIDPTGNGGFESGSTFALNGWTSINGTKNMFNVGSLPGTYAGSYCAYTGNGSAWTGQRNAAVNHFYRDISFPSGETSITLTFYHKETTPDVNDNLKIYLVSTSTTPVAGTSLATGQIGSSYYNSTSWVQETITLPTSAAGTSQRLVFSWTTDAVTNSLYSAIAIDNISLVSAAPVTTSLSSTALTGFGNVCLNNTAGPNSFTITGTNLTTDPVTVGAVTIGGVTDYTYSTTSNGTYSTSLSINQLGGSFSQPIYVKFTPTVVQSYSGNIPVGGGGASSINVAVSGSGVNSKPSVTSGTAVSITTSSAIVSGTISDPGCTSLTAYGIEYSTTSGFVNGTGTAVPSSNLTSGSFSSSLTSLSSGTTYYFHAYATNSAGTSYGTEVSFGTLLTPVTSFPWTEDFETGIFSNWGVQNGSQTNKWYVGSATYNGGTKSAYVSNDNGTTNAYTITATSVSHIYKDITFPASGEFHLAFNWKGQGEGTTTLYDYLRVYLVDVTTTPVAGTSLGTSGQIGTNYNLQGTWQSVDLTIASANLGTTKRLVFSWINDISLGTQPPAALDNIQIYQAANMAYSSSTVTQTILSDVYQNSTNNQVIGIQVVTTGSSSPVTATKFNITTNGTTSLTDIANAKIFYTGTSSTFTTATQFGSTVAVPTDVFDITSSGQTLSNGTNYFWLTYDITSNATGGNIIDGECKTVTVGGSDYTPSPSAAEGSRTIQGAMSGTYNITGVGLFNKITGKNLYAKTFTRKVLREVPVEGSNLLTMSDDSKDKKLKNASEKKQLVEVDEEYSVLYQGDKVYDGPLYISKEEINNYNKGLKDDNGRIMSPNNEAYATLTAAVTAFNTRGISGAITFSLLGATYNAAGGEIFPIVINSISGMSSSNTLTIKPASGKTPTITGAVDGAIFKLYGADYVTIDGSNGTTSKDLTISNTYTTAGTATSIIWIGSTATDGTTNNTIKNCNLTGYSSSTTIAGIVSGSGVTFGNAAEVQNNNNSILNNNFTAVQNGIYHSGNASYDLNLAINNNTFGSTTTASKLGFRGLIIQSAQSFNINDNTVLGVSGNSTSIITGIFVTGASNSGNVLRNRISGVYNANRGAFGFYLASTSTTANITTANNIIYDVSCPGNATLNRNGVGVYIETGGGYNIYYNSINMTTNQTNANGVSACIEIASTITTASSLDLRNNIFINNESLGNCYAIYSGATALVYSNINYNDYYASNATNGKLGYLGTAITTLSAWATATTQDQFSINADPGFTSSTNLVPDPTNANSWALSGNGVHISGVSTDYSGTARPVDINTGAPDIGAYEFAAGSSTPTSVTVTPALGSNDIYVYGRKLINLNFNALGGISSIAVTYYPGINPPGMSGFPSATFMNGYFIVTQTGGSGFAYDITYYYNPPQRGTIVNENLITISKSDNNGTNWDSYVIQGTGSGNYQLNTTAKTIKIYGLSSFSTFTTTGSDVPLPVQLTSFTSSLKDRDVNLSWKTEKEINNAGFDVERSISGSNTWEKVGFVTGKGNSNSMTNYTFEDKKLNTGKYNYRLKQIDYNGNFGYHNLSTAIEVALPTKFNISQNYPNPFNPMTKIDFDLPFDSKVKILLYDMMGREVKTLVNEGKLAGYYTVQFNASDLSSGTYFYRIITKSVVKDYVATKKMVLVK
ncbi:MAG: BNR-repeat neuraminidase N-terminal domain-containing protein [Ignavibacteriota bacterium]